MPFNRSDLILRPKSSEPPKRTPLKIKVQPKVRVKPKESPEVAAFKKRAEELRQRVAQRDPSLVTNTRLEPKRSALKLQQQALQRKINVKPKSAFEWVQAA